MRLLAILLGACVLAGCAEPPPPPLTLPAPENLSQWSVPELVSYTPPVPAPVRPVVHDPPPTPAEQVYAYAPGATYRVPVGIGFPLDIVFSRGEQVLTFTDGDRAPQADGQSRRWQVGQGADGLGVDQQRQHLFVTVTEPGLRNGLTITTTARRAYYVTLESVKSTPIRVLRWTHAPEPGEGPVGPPPPAGPLPPLDTPMRYHVGYVLESNHPQPPTWLPRGIYDDGRKTYILLPEVTLFESAPLVRLVGVNGPQLVNARMFLNVIILDQLAARLELRLGIGEEAEVVTVTRGRLKTIDCPGSPECPQWPAAASQLARRHP